MSPSPPTAAAVGHGTLGRRFFSLLSFTSLLAAALIASIGLASANRPRELGQVAWGHTLVGARAHAGNLKLRSAGSDAWDFGGGSRDRDAGAEARRDAAIAFARWVMWEYDAYSAPAAANLPVVRRWDVPLAAVLPAALLLPLWWSAVRLRQQWLLRHRPHLCPACGYDRRANAQAACPECGAPPA